MQHGEREVNCRGEGEKGRERKEKEEEEEEAGEAAAALRGPEHSHSARLCRRLKPGASAPAQVGRGLWGRGLRGAGVLSAAGAGPVGLRPWGRRGRCSSGRQRGRAQVSGGSRSPVRPSPGALP